MDAEVIIFRLTDDPQAGRAHTQVHGSEVTRLTVDSYKWAPKNAWRKWLNDASPKPKPGWYVAVYPEGYNYGSGRKGALSIFEVSYPSYVVRGMETEMGPERKL